MSYYPDLSNSCDLAIGDDVRAIGWLSIDHSFTTGPVDIVFQQTLKKHIADPWAFVLAAGGHTCEFCLKFWSSANVIIPTENCVYIAPSMISHYIEAHQYQPPAEFIRAVLDCPEQSSPEYMKLIERFPHHWEW